MLTLCAVTCPVTSRAATVLGTSGDGIGDFVYHQDTGDLRFEYDGAIPSGKLLEFLSVKSTSGILLPQNANIDPNTGHTLSNVTVALTRQLPGAFFPNDFDI